MKKRDVKTVARGAISALLLSFVPITTWGQGSDSSLPPLPALPTIPQYDTPEPELPAVTLPPLSPIALPTLPELSSEDISVKMPTLIQGDEPTSAFRSSYKHSVANTIQNLPTPSDLAEYIVYSPDELFATSLVSKEQFDRMTSKIITEKVEKRAINHSEKQLEVSEFIPQPPIRPLLPPSEPVMANTKLIEVQRVNPVLPPLEPVIAEESTFVSTRDFLTEIGVGSRAEITPPPQSITESIREEVIAPVLQEEKFAFAESGIYVPPAPPITDGFQYQSPPQYQPQSHYQQSQERVAYRNDSMVTPNIDATPAPSRNVLAAPTEDRSGISFFSLKNMKNNSDSIEVQPPSKASSRLSVRSEDLPPSPILPPSATNSNKRTSSDYSKSQPSVKNDFKPLAKPESKPTLIKSGNETKSNGSSLSSKMQPATDEMKRWGAGISAGFRSINPFAKDK